VSFNRQNGRPAEIKLAKQVIATFDAPLDLADCRPTGTKGSPRQLVF
jgi:hypothetical protein